MEAVILFVLLLFLVIIAYSDVVINRIPNICLLGVLLCSCTAAVLLENVSSSERFMGCFFISLPMLLCALIKPGAFGGGDIKLMAFSGIYLGLDGIITAFAAAVFLAGSYIFIMTAAGRNPRVIPFGPFLSAGIIMEALRLLFL